MLSVLSALNEMCERCNPDRLCSMFERGRCRQCFLHPAILIFLLMWRWFWNSGCPFDFHWAICIHWMKRAEYKCDISCTTPEELIVKTFLFYTPLTLGIKLKKELWRTDLLFQNFDFCVCNRTGLIIMSKLALICQQSCDKPK